MSLGRVDRYELLELIGQGSFGGVYRARHVHTGQVHALKLARDAVDPEVTARVLVEARAAASLHHPNVVGVIDGGVTAHGEAFIVMELLEGRTLAQIIAQEGPLPFGRAVRIARQMLEGLAVAHASGIIHRDVKPSNVFVTMASNVTGGDLVKVIDFGISKVRPEAGSQGAMTLPGVAMGTPGYMAPEQLGDARSVDPRADVYAVGATLFEMLTKRRPIDADNFETWMRKLRHEPAPLVATFAQHVPPMLAAVVDRALARDPDARWPTAAAMREALDIACAGSRESFAAQGVDTPRAVVQSAVAPTSTWGASVPPAVAPTSTWGASAAPPSFAPSGPPRPPDEPRRSTSPGIVPWLVGALVLVVGVVGVVGVGAGALVYIRTRRAPSSAPPPAPQADASGTLPPSAAPAVAVSPSASIASARPPPPQGKTGVAPVPATISSVPTTATATPAAGVGSVRISPPRIVGELRQDAFMMLASRARSAVEQCNPDRRAIVIKVDLMIGNKKITIAQPSVNTNPGDPLIARCVAQSLKDAQFSGFAPGDSGIYQEAQFTWK